MLVIRMEMGVTTCLFRIFPGKLVGDHQWLMKLKFTMVDEMEWIMNRIGFYLERIDME